MNTLTYKGYQGQFEYDSDADMFHGEVLHLNDVVTFQGRSIDELKQALADSVEDYLLIIMNLTGLKQMPPLRSDNEAEDFVANSDLLQAVDADGFDWDNGNWPKCGKHGVSREEIEEMLFSNPLLLDDPYHNETRTRAIGTASSGRYIFVVFIVRMIGNNKLIRPISARYMHKKEIERYEDYS